MALENSGSERAWKRFCESLQKRLNLGYFLEDFSIFYSLWIVLGGIGVGVFRVLGWDPLWRADFLLLGIIFIGIGVWIKNRKRFFNWAETRIYVESRLKLNSRLTAAHEGVASWPDFPAELPSLLDWRWMNVLRPIGGAFILWLLVHWIPPLFQDQRSVMAHQMPPALQDVQSWVETLRENPILDPTKVEAWSEQLKALAQNSPEEWYRNQNLEAADALRQNMEQALTDLNQAASQIVSAAERAGILPSQNSKMKETGMTERSREKLAKQLSELGSTHLALNPDFQEKLKKMSASDFKTVSAEEMREMLKSMEEVRKSCQACLNKNGKPVHEIAMGTELSESGTGPDGEQKTAPLTLSRNESVTDSTKTEAFNASYAEKPFLGEVIGVSTGEHEVDKKPLQVVEAKQEGAQGSGGDAAWKSRLTPDEERELERFYK